MKQRFGAISKHGSICVTERVIETFKYEYLSRVPLIRGFGHLKQLCESFYEWYNDWRPHMTLNGCRPNDYYRRDIPEPVARDSKTVPLNIEKSYSKKPASPAIGSRTPRSHRSNIQILTIQGRVRLQYNPTSISPPSLQSKTHSPTFYPAYILFSKITRRCQRLNYQISMSFLVLGWPREVALPGLPQIRTCALTHPAPRDHGFAVRR
ncbi:MAG: transposase [Deltaproteobacteria bacterium]|nr:transposase [Deltaproteobacteria bacterium]